MALSLRHAVDCKTDEVLEWQCLYGSYLLGQELLKAPMDLGERALAAGASHALCSAVQRNPVAACWLLARGNDRARSLQCSAAQSPSGVPNAALTFNCLPVLGVQDTVLHLPCCGDGVQLALGVLSAV